MPPKVKFSKIDLIEAAIEIVEAGGLKDLTARNVATRLKSSTAPVYAHFSTMDELALAVIKKTQQLLIEYTSRPYTERLFLNMGTGIAMFACEHGQLYRELMLEGDRYGDLIDEFVETMKADLANDQHLQVLSADERHLLLEKMWTFTYGFASMICVGLIKDCTEEKIIKTLGEMGRDVIIVAMGKYNCDPKSSE